MADEELRELVREAIRRRAGEQPEAPVITARPSLSHHPSQTLVRVLAGGDQGDGTCLIEPAVICNHCGYCQSYGH